MRVPTLLLALGFVAASHALTFTSPLPGSTIDLTSPLKISWIPSSSDPSTFTLFIINTLSGSSDQPQTLGINIRTSSTSYTLPANTISSYGDGFELLAATSGGDSLGSSGEFSLADGVYTLQTASDGALTIVTSSTQGSGPSSTSAQSAAVTSSTGSGSGSTAVSSSVESSKSTAESVGPTASTTAASPKSSSARASSTGTYSSGASASSTTSTGASAAATSSSSDTSSNLGFDSAASTVKGSAVVSYAVFVGALAFALLAY